MPAVSHNWSLIRDLEDADAEKEEEDDGSRVRILEANSTPIVCDVRTGKLEVTNRRSSEDLPAPDGPRRMILNKKS